MLTGVCFPNLGTFVLLILPILNFGVNAEAKTGNCISPESKKVCCTNYHDVNGSCIKCPIGSYGENCTETCPYGKYGEFCLQLCNCTMNQQCNFMFGCLECLDGTTSRNCEARCPDNMYGKLCSQKCQCKGNEQCDRIFGCIDCQAGGYGKNWFCIYESYRYMFWIIPILLGAVIFIIVCVCRRCRKTKPRNFVDIPTYTTERNNTTHDDYDHVVFPWNSSNNNTLERSKISKTASKTETGEAGMSDENMEAGVYNTLNLRVFDYEEPIKHQPLKRSKSENSFLYVDCSIPLEPSAFDAERVLNCNRASSLRLTKSTDRNNLGKNGKDFTKTHEKDEPFLDFNVYDLTTLPGKSNASQQQLFLKELSSQLLNLKKY